MARPGLPILLSLFVAPLLAPATSAAPPPPPPNTPAPAYPEVVKKALEAAHERLETKLAAEYPRERIVTRTEPGPFSTVVAVAAFPDAYPGTGVLRLPLDAESGVGYGRHGERTLADFARERGWLAKPPPTDELVRFMNVALFDGVAILDKEPAPRVTHDKGMLTLELVRRYMPSHAGEWLVVIIPKEGPEQVERRPMHKPLRAP